MQIEIEELKQLIECSQKQRPTGVVNLENFGVSPTKELLWFPGKKYFIRTVTHHHTGVLLAVTPYEIVLEQAAWIADDGRLTEALKTGVFKEVEMFPSGPVGIGRGSIIDAVQIVDIPTSQK